ncbi:hypothetical protein [Lentibacillus juripiscarius]|uniref:hypothetical protein n=1 Tax=Lentibacillus juripiscarius TaxID=257446 RepID=UPI0036D39DC8
MTPQNETLLNNLYKLRRNCYIDFCSVQSLSPQGISSTSTQALFVRFRSVFFTAGTASASVAENRRCGVFRHVLFPQDKESYVSDTSHEEKVLFFFEESTALRSNQSS